MLRNTIAFLIAWLFIQVASVSAQNLLNNPGFEKTGSGGTGSQSWKSDGSGTYSDTRDTTLPHSGVADEFLETNGQGNNYASMYQDTAAGSVIPGQNYDINLYYASPDSNSYPSVEVNFLDASNNNLGLGFGQSFDGGPDAVPNQYYFFDSGPFAAPAGASSAQIIINGFTLTLSGLDGVHIDDVSFSQVPEPASISILGIAGFGMFARRRKFRQATI
jgi:hypothetical protein